MPKANGSCHCIPIIVIANSPRVILLNEQSGNPEFIAHNPGLPLQSTDSQRRCGEGILLANLFNKYRNIVPIQCGVEMKGAVPQKGLKMKMTINRGPLVGGKNVGILIPFDICAILSDFLWKWSANLPKEVSQYLEVIIANPFAESRDSLSYSVDIKVVLSGEYLHKHDHLGEMVKWKNEFNCITPLSLFSFHWGDSARRGLEKELNERLQKTLQVEVDSYRSVSNILLALIKLSKNT